MTEAEKQLLLFFYENRKKYSIKLSPEQQSSLADELKITRGVLRSYLSAFEKAGYIERLQGKYKTVDYEEYRVIVRDLDTLIPDKESVFKKIKRLLGKN